ncbi:MAG TPA: DUF1634 domain-containing protein [Fimbriimonadaceae bacterium]|nr:DUF1634 domain-containing protein [Fimbriimonadaceae bacterium]
MTDEEGHRIEIIIGRLLQIGVGLSAVTVAFGAIVYLVQHGLENPPYGKFRGEPSGLTSFSGVFSGVAAFHGVAIIQLGLLLLIATPVARVLFSLLAFLHEKDWLYGFFTLIVLSVLAYGLFSR